MATKEQSTFDFEALAGEGLDVFTADTLSTAYLSMIQPGSASENPENPAGTWRNSALNENYGNKVEVVVGDFKTVWTERASEHPYNTVGRYRVGGIEVEVKKPKPGQKGFPTMTNPATGNKVEELFVYGIMLKNAPEQGILFFSPTAGSMKTCKQWNAAIRSARMPSGKPAGIIGYSWILEVGLVQNPAKPNEKIARFIKAERGELILQEKNAAMVTEHIIPARQGLHNIALLAAPESSGDVE